MAEREINGKTVAIDNDGYLADASQWDKEIADVLAKEVDIAELNDEHWKVINFLRAEYQASGQLPTMRKIGKRSGVDMKGLYRIFPDGPLKKAAKIAGLPKPQSCV